MTNFNAEKEFAERFDWRREHQQSNLVVLGEIAHAGGADLLPDLSELVPPIAFRRSE